MSKEPLVKMLGPTEVELFGKTYKFRDPNEWTVGEVSQIEDKSTIFLDGQVTVSIERLKSLTLAKALGISESEALKLPYHVGNNLYEIVRWRPVPLEDWPISSAESEEEPQPPKELKEPEAQ